MKKIQRMTAFLLILAMLLTGCGKDRKTEKTESAEKETTVPTTEPVPTAPADGNPNDITCQGSYTASVDSAVVASAGSAQLTNRLLNQYYWAEVAACSEGPDWGQSLDTQLHPEGITWQQYFLRNALNTWHTHQALIQTGENDINQPPELYEEYLINTAVEEEKLYYGGFQINEMHQSYIDSLPDVVSQLAGAQGLSSEEEGALLQYAELSNRAYAYFTELSYGIEFTEEEIQTYAAGGGEKTVDLRHILILPSEDTEEAWEAAMKDAQNCYDKWKGAKKVTEWTFAEVAHDHSEDIGSDLHGGLYSNVVAGQLEPALDAWAFAPERQVGDVEVIRSGIGAHVVYFSGSGTTGEAQALREMTRQQALAQLNTARETYPMQVSYSAICLAETGPKVMADDILYPDVAHERYTKVPLYFQQDYSGQPYGNYTVASHGCGITAMAMIASYLLDKEITPADIGLKYGEYCMRYGTDLMLFTYIPPEEGFYLDAQVFNWPEVEEALNNGQLVISMQYPGIFTRTGHFLVLTHLNEEGRVMMRDSNIYNYRRYDGYKEGFKVGAITDRCMGFWIYSHKMVRTPACSRCGDPGTLLPGMLNSDYSCERCREAVTRRDIYLDICTQ